MQNFALNLNFCKVLMLKAEPDELSSGLANVPNGTITLSRIGENSGELEGRIPE